MTTKVKFPRVLQQYCDGSMEIEVDGDTVGELLDEVKKQHPALYECICDETGQLRRHINLFINSELLPRKPFETRVDDDDVISVFQAVSGG